jgi:hypothetical protein
MYSNHYTLYLLFFLPSPGLCPEYHYTFYHALKHHHSLLEIISSPSLSYSSSTSHYLFCFPHYLSDVCLIRGSFVELVYLFYFPFFPITLILFTLPLSLIEHHHFRLLNIHFQFFLPHILSQTHLETLHSLPLVLCLTFRPYLPHIS